MLAVANGSSSESWAHAFERAKSLVAQMTVEEVVNITNGFPGDCIGNTGSVPRLGVPPLCLADGPNGVRGQEFASAFPAGIHMAATFDRTLLYQYGRALGYEFRGLGVNVALGPVAGPLGRIAVGSRNWEGLSNDPYLADVNLAGMVKGMQDSGAMATVKHWLLNEQDYRRNPSDLGESLSSNIDDRTLHELYAYPFMGAIRDGASGVMCSYNRVNNSYACQNSKLLNGLLKTDLGFEGFVVSDWGAGHTGIASANAGLDLIMPDEGFWGPKLVEAVNNGSVAHERVKDMATRVLAAWYRLDQDKDYPPVSIIKSNLQKMDPVDVQNGHGKLIREMGAAGTVLVRNVNNTLPFKKPRYISIFGYDATVPGDPWHSYNVFGANGAVGLVPVDDVFASPKISTLNGTLITAGGSGSTTPPYVISPFQALQTRMADDGGVIRWDFYSINPTPYYNSEACLVFINTYPDEGFDRMGLRDDFSDQLVENVASNCSNTIVIIHSAGMLSQSVFSFPKTVCLHCSS